MMDAGCTKISEGCQNCYAERMSKRLKGRYGYPADDPFKPGVMHNDVLHKPAHWKKPRKIFVCSMGDLFHDAVNWNHLFAVWQMMGMIRHHTFIVLTKRPGRAIFHLTGDLGFHLQRQDWCDTWPLPNVFLGVTAENQQRADERIPILLQIPAAVRFVSVEPMLGPVDLDYFLRCPGCGYSKKDMALHCDHHLCSEKKNKILDWIICGSESGSKRRFAPDQWFRDLKDQCVAAQVPFFFKQKENLSKNNVEKMPRLDGKIWNEYPKEEP